MIRSMTGYGEAEHAVGAGRLLAEVRTVNHRHFHANFRFAGPLARWEPDAREWLRVRFPRGAVNCALRYEPDAADPALAGGLHLDEARVAAYLALFRTLSEKFGVAGEPDLALLARFGDIVRREEPGSATAPEVSGDDVRAVLEAAAAQAREMREQEGARLQHDLEERLRALDDALLEVERVAPERLTAELDRLREAVRVLAEGVGISEERLAQEIAFLAERWDVNEELVRFRAHNAAFRVLLAAGGAEPVGKRLAFLVQEMHREANTIGSKANDARIAHQVVLLKDEIERLREQVENVE